MVIWKFVVISILIKKNAAIILNLYFVPTFFFSVPQLTVSVFPECLETTGSPADVLTGRYGHTVSGGSLSSMQLVYVWSWSLYSPL